MVLAAIIELVLAIFDGMWALTPAMLGAAIELFMEIVNAVYKTADRARMAVIHLLDNVIASIWTMLGQFYAMGHRMVDSITSGVKNAASTLIDSVVNAANRSIAAVKATLKMHSPSKVWQEIGENEILGMTLGVEAMGPGLTDATLGVVNAAMPSASVFSESLVNLPKQNANSVTNVSNANAGTTLVVEAGAITISLDDLDKLKTLEDFLDLMRVKARKR